MVIIVTKQKIAQSTIESKVNEIIYCIQQDIKKINSLPYLFEKMKEEIRELYSFSYGVASYQENEPGYSGDPFQLTTSIIGTKEYYNKRIQRILKRESELRELFDSLSIEDKETLTDAFITSKQVDEQEVKRIIQKHLDKFEQIYIQDDNTDYYQGEVKVDEQTRQKRVAKSLQQLRGLC